MKTSLTADIRRGDETQVLLRLQNDGVLPDDYVAISTNDALRGDIVAAILKHRLFATPEEQIRRLLEINEQVWKDASITEVAIHAIGDAPEAPASDEAGIYCVALLAETGDAVKTFERNWAACVHVHGVDKTWKWDGLLFTPQGVKSRADAKPRPVGLRWAIAELGRAYQNQAVEQARPALDAKSVMGMGRELPLIGALHPKWATAMNGAKIPFVDAPDLAVAASGRGDFGYAPCLGFGRDNGEVDLVALQVAYPYPSFGSGSLR